VWHPSRPGGPGRPARDRTGAREVGARAAVRSVLGSVAVVVALVLTIAAIDPPAEPPTPASESEPAPTAVPMCGDVYGAAAVTHSSAPDEHTAQQRREWVDDLHAWAEAEVPESFAGTYGDTVAFTQDAEDLEDRVRARFGSHLDVVEVNHTAAELEETRRAAADEMRRQRGPGDETSPEPGQLTDVTTLTRANRVRLTVAGLDHARAVELTERYGALRICLVDRPVPGHHEPADPELPDASEDPAGEPAVS
jgi:hypothetical protein